MKNKICKNITQKMAHLFNEQIELVPGIPERNPFAIFSSNQTFREANFLQTLLDCPDFRIYRQELNIKSGNRKLVRFVVHYVIKDVSRGLIEFFEGDVDNKVVLSYVNVRVPANEIEAPQDSVMIKLEG